MGDYTSSFFVCVFVDSLKAMNDILGRVCCFGLRPLCLNLGNSLEQIVIRVIGNDLESKQVHRDTCVGEVRIRGYLGFQVAELRMVSSRWYQLRGPHVSSSML